MSTTPEGISILLVTRNFPPRLGGMEKLNWHIAEELGTRFDVSVIAPRGAANSGLPFSIEMTEVRLSPLPMFFLETAWNALMIAAHKRPDIVLAGSGLTAPLVWLAARASGAKAIAYLHGLDITARHPIYRLIWPRFLRWMDQTFVNSKATAKLARDIGIPADSIHVVHPGVSIPHMDPTARGRVRSARRLGERPILLSVGRLTQRKGILEFVRACMPAIVAVHPNCLLLIAGESPKHALHKVNINSADILSTAEESGVSDNIKFLESPSDDELTQLYQASDLHVFPVKEVPGNPEGFGMVAIEAAAHGLPTVAFDTGGVSDAICDGVSGRLIPAGDYSLMTQVILRILADEDQFTPTECRDFAATFEWSKFGEKLSQKCRAHLL